MRETKFILVEGMPGTGKSTLSQFVHLQLQANGRPSYWCHEERAAHPVRLFYEPDRHRSWSDYCDEATARWQSYAHELQEQDGVAVLDAAVLQNHVRSMMIFCCDRNAILDLVGRIESQIASLNPVWIYLKPTDVEQNFRDVFETRGQQVLQLWIGAHDRFPYTRRAQVDGYPGFIGFWKEFDEIADRIFERLSISKLWQNISNGDWGAQYSEILDFLDLRVPSESSSLIVLEHFSGKYVPLDNPAASGVTLDARDGCLIASVDQPTFDVQDGPIGCYREVRLIPNGISRDCPDGMFSTARAAR